MKDALWYAATIVNHPIGLINNARQTHLAWIGIGSAVSFSSRAVITHRTRIGRIIVAGFAPLFGRINNSIPRRWSRDSWKELIERIFYNFYNYDEKHVESMEPRHKFIQSFCKGDLIQRF